MNEAKAIWLCVTLLIASCHVHAESESSNSFFSDNFMHYVMFDLFIVILLWSVAKVFDLFINFLGKKSNLKKQVNS